MEHDIRGTIAEDDPQPNRTSLSLFRFPSHQVTPSLCFGSMISMAMQPFSDLMCLLFLLFVLFDLLFVNIVIYRNEYDPFGFG
jgi:hypothetical protein